MVANRINPAAEQEEAAAHEEGQAAPASQPAGGLKAWLPLAATFVTMPLLAYATTQFVLLPQLRKDLGVTAAATTPSKSKPSGEATGAKVESVSMNKLVVNVAGTMGSHYLLVSLSVAGSDPDFKAKIQAHDPQLRDLACGALATKTIGDLEKPGARNLIRSELLSGFNNILGGALIKEIYLTEFAIQ